MTPEKPHSLLQDILTKEQQIQGNDEEKFPVLKPEHNGATIKGGGYCKRRSNTLVKADWKLHGMT